jgi:hypothetical protein
MISLDLVTILLFLYYSRKSYTFSSLVGSEVLTAVVMKGSISCDTTNYTTFYAKR